MNRLPLYSDRLLPLYPDAPLALHPLDQRIDLGAIRVTWQHVTYGGVSFNSPRLRPTYLRLRAPEGPVPSLIAISKLLPTGYETDVTQPSGDFDWIRYVSRYYRYDSAVFDPEAGVERSRWGRLLPAGGGFCYAHGMELQHARYYGKNAHSQFTNIGVLVIGLNLALLDASWTSSWFPDLLAPQFAYLTAPDPPFPTRTELLETVSAPVPLTSGNYTVELAHPAVEYNRGYLFYERRNIELRPFGSVHMNLEIHTAADQPLANMVDAQMTRAYHRQFASDVGVGTLPAVAD